LLFAFIFRIWEKTKPIWPQSGTATIDGAPMPTLFRFLFICAAIVGIIYGSMVSLVMLVEPRDRDITVRIPSERLNPPVQ
jgi:hypothetical protein